MSQKDVERVLGRLLTEESFRVALRHDPAATVASLAGLGLDLTNLEREALVTLDAAAFERLARTIPPRLQKVELANPTRRTP